MKAVLTLALKDLKILFRDKFALFWIFAFPLVYALFFGAIFGGDSGSKGVSKMAVCIVDEDGSPESGALVERLAAHASLRAERIPLPEGGGGDVGDSAASVAPRPVRLRELDVARGLVRKGRRVAYVRVLPGYGDSPFFMFGGGGGEARVEMGIDPSRSAEAGYLQGVLMETLFGGMAESFTDRDKIKEAVAGAQRDIAASEMGALQKGVLQTFFGALTSFADEVDMDALAERDGAGADGIGGGGLNMDGVLDIVDVVKSAEPGASPRSSFDVTFPSGVLWGLMSVAMGFAITIVRERTRGTLLRLRTAPVSGAQILAGKALGCFLMCLIVMAFLLGFAVLALGVRVDSPGLLALSMGSTALCFTGLMMTVSVLGKTEESVAGAAWGLMMPMAMIGGGMIPLIAMPSWLVTLSDFSPFKWGILAIEGAVWRGFSLADCALPCAILVGVGAVFFAIGVLLFRRSSG